MSRRRYPLSVATLFRDGLDLRYEVTGSGPATADYVVADMAGDVVAAVNEAGFERFFVLGYLVDDLPCPLFAFWGDDDEEIGQAGGTQGLADGLRARGLQHTSFAGLDHEGMLARIAEAVPAVLAWFEEL